MDVRDLGGRVAVVTGAGSGIGRATALLLAERGADLAICDRDLPGLEVTAKRAVELGRAVLAERVDVSDREQMQAFAGRVHERWEAADLLVNNAGVCLTGNFLDTELDDWEWIVSVNQRGVVHGCHLFVPPMVRRGRGGHVVNLSSTAAFLPPANLAAYATTKFAVLGLSEALRAELAVHGIGVTAVCPGVVASGMWRRTLMRGAGASEEERNRLVRIYERRGYTPEQVARGILRAIGRNRAVAPIAPEAHVLYAMKRMFPALVRGMNRLYARLERRRLGT